MASPAEPNHPLTPPAEATSHPTTTNLTSPREAKSRVEVLLSEPLTSLSDDGTSKRPRDHRLIHLLLAAYGISAYQERVPLQLMDFAYRYTSAVLSDAVHIQNEGYDQAEGATSSKGRGKNQNKNEDGDISLASLRMSIQSRLGYQMSGSLPKEFLKQLADEKNRIALSTGMKDSERSGATIGGLKLPHERYCLTGMGWGLKDEWESEGEESIEADATQPTSTLTGDKMQIDGAGEDGEGEDEELGTMEDVFGPDQGGDDGGDGDTEMQV